jgi:Tfp pilus assembly protein PilX
MRSGGSTLRHCSSREAELDPVRRRARDHAPDSGGAGRDERGTALLLALIVLLILTGIVVAFLSASAFEPRISRNHNLTVRARFMAEAGIEYAYDMLATRGDAWNDLLAGATCSQGAVLGAASAPLPGLGSAYGTFTVRVRNDCDANDQTLTGTTPDTATGPCDAVAAGGATRDANCQVLVESTGAIGGATRTISTVVSKIAMPPVSGALAFSGLRADVKFGGAGIVIDGRDSKLADDPGTPTGAGPAVYGIAVNGKLPALAGGVEAALVAAGQGTIRGKHEADANAAGEGAATVEADPSLVPRAVSDFVSTTRSVADIVVDAGPGKVASIRDVGSTCSADAGGAGCWGTPSRPKIVHVRGVSPDIAGRPPAIAIVGDSRGTGILVVEDANLEIVGHFRWDGLIVVSGRNVGIRYRGDGVQRVYGATIVHASSDEPSTNADILGPVSVLYSREALDLVRKGLGRRLVTTSGWAER